MPVKQCIRWIRSVVALFQFLYPGQYPHSFIFFNLPHFPLVRGDAARLLGAVLAGQLWLILGLCFPPLVLADGPLPFSEDFNQYGGAGFAPGPTPGQLDSDRWIVTGLSDGDLAFGDTQTGGDFARGTSTGGETTGGIYAFDRGGGDYSLGVQPGGSDFTPGQFLLRLQNTTTATVTLLNLAYDIPYLNDRDRASSLALAYSSDGLAYTSLPTLDFTTPLTADILGWQVISRSTLLTGLNLAPGDFFYLRWTGSDAGGSGSRDEYGLDNVAVSVPTGDIPPFVVATSPVHGATDVAVDTTVNIRFSETVTTTVDTFGLECPAGHPIPFDTLPPPPGNGTDYSLTPVSSLPQAESCTARIAKDEVLDQDGSPDPMMADFNFEFTTAPPPPQLILIGEFLYDGLTPSTEGDEFVEVCNPNPNPVDLTGYKVGDEETHGGGESMYHLPVGYLLEPDRCLVVAKDAAQFQARFNFSPDFGLSDLAKYTAWGGGSLSLANTGDELLLLGPNDEILDSVAYRQGEYALLGLEPDATAPEPYSLQRIWPVDTDSMPHDFVRTEPNPGSLTESPPPPAVPPPPAPLSGGMNAYWGHLHAHTSYSDGAGPPYYALAMARAAGLHFYAITDHGWWLDPAAWTKTLSQTNNATVPGQFVALRGVEWTHQTTGHINVFNSDTLLNRTDPAFDTLPELYAWLAANPEAIAQFNHPDPAYGGNFNQFAFDAAAAPQIYLQEIGNHAQGYVTYEPAFVQSNAVGWRTSPTNNGDTHTANWGRDTGGARTGLVAPDLTPAELLAALRARRVFATEDSNLALALRSDGTWMGSSLSAAGAIPLTVEFVDPDPESVTLYLYDGNLLLSTVSFPASTGRWTTTVEARAGHYFWVKLVQADGHIAYSTPLWIEGRLEPEQVYLNEVLPAPYDWDWDGNGTADYNDEWLELFNPLDRPVGLGGWRLVDASGTAYDLPLGITLPARDFVTFYHAQTGLGLNNGGDTVHLVHPNGTVVDSYSYPHSPGYDGCWCRLPDGGPDWYEDCGPSPTESNWRKPPPGPLPVTIYEAKRLTYNAWVQVKGRITAPPGLLGARTMYIQDHTAGIMVYLPQDHRLSFNLGDEVTVTGNLRTYHEEWEIAVKERQDVKGGEPGMPPPPLPIVTTSLLEPYEGMLVMLQGQAVGFKGYTTFWVDDGTDPARVYIRRSTGIRKPYIERGSPVTVVGIVSQYSDKDSPSREDYRLLLRYQTDLVLPAVASPEPPPGWPSMLPETGR